jgi:hypothetical protein
MNTVDDDGLLGIFKLGLMSLILGFLMNLGHQTRTMFCRALHASLDWKSLLGDVYKSAVELGFSTDHMYARSQRN